MKGFTLVISMAAKMDLDAIYQFSSNEWGSHQAERYLNAFKVKLIKLSNNPKAGQERQDLLANTRSIPVGHHIIFYRISDQTLQVLRILHERQDPIKQVK